MSTLTTLISRLDQFSPLERRMYPASMMQLWDEESIATMNIPKAYILLKYGALPPHQYALLMRAVLPYHVIHANRKATPYTSLSPQKRASYHQELELALNHEQGFADWFALVPAGERWFDRIQDRFERQFVFRRDPAGSVDLAAFAADAESVHRSSTQDMIAASLKVVMDYPVETADTFIEILDVANPLKASMDRFAADYDTLSVPLMSGTVCYRDVVDHVWAYIRRSEFRGELVRRLFEEVEDGHRTCPNGRLARLLNVLQGYDQTLPSVEDPGILLQDRMALIKTMPAAGRQLAAVQAFRDFKVSGDEQGAWLEALMEA